MSIIVLFGSRAKNTHKPGSGIDLAIDVEHAIKLHEIARLRATLENLPIKRYLETIRHIDDIKSPKKVFRAAVKAELFSEQEGAVCLNMANGRNETSHT